MHQMHFDKFSMIKIISYGIRLVQLTLEELCAPGDHITELYHVGTDQDVLDIGLTDVDTPRVDELD